MRNNTSLWSFCASLVLSNKIANQVRNIQKFLSNHFIPHLRNLFLWFAYRILSNFLPFWHTCVWLIPRQFIDFLSFLISFFATETHFSLPITRLLPPLCSPLIGYSIIDSISFLSVNWVGEVGWDPHLVYSILYWYRLSTSSPLRKWYIENYIFLCQILIIDKRII